MYNNISKLITKLVEIFTYNFWKLKDLVKIFSNRFFRFLKIYIFIFKMKGYQKLLWLK